MGLLMTRFFCDITAHSVQNSPHLLATARNGFGLQPPLSTHTPCILSAVQPSSRGAGCRARNLMFWHTEDPEIGDKNLQVHFGFKKMVDHAMASRLPRAIRTEVTDCDEMYIVGHSLGGAVAALFTLRLVKDMEGKKVAAQEEATALFGNDRTKWPALSLITYAQPRVGNDAVAKLLDDANLLRINVAGDPVPQVPLWPWNTSCYVHGGRSVWLAPVYDPRPYIVEGEVTTDWLAQLTVALASLWLWFLHLPSFYVWRWSVSGHKAIKELAAVANRAATRN